MYEKRTHTARHIRYVHSKCIITLSLSRFLSLARPLSRSFSLTRSLARAFSRSYAGPRVPRGGVTDRTLYLPTGLAQRWLYADPAGEAAAAAIAPARVCAQRSSGEDSTAVGCGSPCVRHRSRIAAPAHRLQSHLDCQ